MSEPIPESIPTSADPRSRRPVKRARTGPNVAVASQADEIEYLMQEPERPINLPESSSENRSTLAAPPEIVANVQGSSAGAGSGEFHVYKASRRREYERLRAMDEEAKKEDEDSKWEEEMRLKKERDEERERRNREKRNKKKNKKGGQQSGANGDKSNGASGNVKEKGSTKKPLELPKRSDEKEDVGNDFAVAEVVKENGIVIHDDD